MTATGLDLDLEEFLADVERAMRASGRIIPGNGAYVETRRPQTLREAMQWETAGNQTLELMAGWTEKLCRAYRERGSRDPSKNIFIGPTGCGKTKLSKFVFSYANSVGGDIYREGKYQAGRTPYAIFVSWRRLCASGGDQEWEDFVKFDVSGALMVVIDDIGAETDQFKGGASTARLQHVLEVAERKWLLITTNVKPDKWASIWGARVASRLEACTKRIIPDDVPDYRKKQR